MTGWPFQQNQLPLEGCAAPRGWSDDLPLVFTTLDDQKLHEMRVAAFSQGIVGLRTCNPKSGVPVSCMHVP